MVLSLEKAGLISREPGTPISITVLLERSLLPELQPGDAQPVKTTVTRSKQYILKSRGHVVRGWCAGLPPAGPRVPTRLCDLAMLVRWRPLSVSVNLSS